MKNSTYRQLCQRIKFTRVTSPAAFYANKRDYSLSRATVMVSGSTAITDLIVTPAIAELLVGTGRGRNRPK